MSVQLASTAMDQRVEPAAYARVFEGHNEGAAILEDLTRRFGGRLYVPGGLEGERQTLVNLGARKVLDFIVGMINQGNGINDDIEVLDP